MEPGLMRKLYEGVPPITEKLSDPVQQLKQPGLMAVHVIVSGEGCVMLTEPVNLHPMLSVTVKFCIPADKLRTADVVWADGLHENVNGALPAGVIVAWPFPLLKQRGCVNATVPEGRAGWIMLTVCDVTQ